MPPEKSRRLPKKLLQRAKIMRAVRRFFEQHDYVEIETPLRIPAPAPEAHIDLISSEDWYLQPSPELCMKRMLAAGYPRIFQICKCFRKGERGRLHLPELTMLEWYTAGSDYTEMMDQCEQLLLQVASEMGYGSSIDYQGMSIDLSAPWQRLSVRECFHAFAGMAPETALRQSRFEEMLVDRVEPRLERCKPIFLCDFPVDCGSLARRKRTDPRLTERFELYIGGIELCNAFSELTDPVEQRRRFKTEQAIRRKLEKPVYPMPEPYLSALENMPEAAGNALGIDRLTMLLTNAARIDEVVAFTPETL